MVIVGGQKKSKKHEVIQWNLGPKIWGMGCFAIHPPRKKRKGEDLQG